MKTNVRKVETNKKNSCFQFVELKGSVFKKFDKNNLFQVSCSDVRERFHLFVLLFIVVLQTMKEYTWKEGQLLGKLKIECLKTNIKKS